MKIALISKLKKIDALIIIEGFINEKDKDFFASEIFAEIKKYSQTDFSREYIVKMNDTSGIKEIIFVKNAKKNSLSSEEAKVLGATIAKISDERKIKNMAIFSEHLAENLPNFLEGFLLGSYKFSKFLTSEVFGIDSLSLILDKKTYRKYLGKIQETEQIAAAINYVRDLVNFPPNYLSPVELAEEATKIAKLSRNIKVEILEKEKLKKLGINALLAVSKGSPHPPKMVILKYFGAAKNDRPIVFVGKGVTFDSGGYYLKSPPLINDMKYDMAGAGVVLGIFYLLSRFDLPLNIVGVISCTENVLAGDSYKPSDIIKMHSGKTVEITNTDAEGRLILADALSYASSNFSPKILIDIATLTGACMVALGMEMSAILGNNQELIDRLLRVGKECDEASWQLPLDPKVIENLKGENADLVNFSPNIKAGVIMGAAFLSYFVNNIPWAHIDMGGSAWCEKDYDYFKKGGSGRNLKLLWNFLKQFKNL